MSPHNIYAEMLLSDISDAVTSRERAILISMWKLVMRRDGTHSSFRLTRRAPAVARRNRRVLLIHRV